MLPERVLRCGSGSGGGGDKVAVGMERKAYFSSLRCSCCSRSEDGSGVRALLRFSRGIFVVNDKLMGLLVRCKFETN